MSHRRPPLAPPYVADGPVHHDSPPVTAHPHSRASPIRSVTPRRLQHGADTQPAGPSVAEAAAAARHVTPTQRLQA